MVASPLRIIVSCRGSRRIEHFLSQGGILLSVMLEVGFRLQHAASFRPRYVCRALPPDKAEDPHDEEPHECGGGHH